MRKLWQLIRDWFTPRPARRTYTSKYWDAYDPKVVREMFTHSDETFAAGLGAVGPIVFYNPDDASLKEVDDA